jgi:hypothetical protein
VVCFNPKAVERDQQVRKRLVTSLGELIADTDRLSATKRAELCGQLSTKPGLHRYLKVTPGGLLCLDGKAIAAEAKLDGKFLLRSSDPALSAEDIALSYKQLIAVERGWRDLKQLLDLRPVYHHREDRIRAHVLLCWLALLLIRLVETTTGPGPTCATSCSGCTLALHRPGRHLPPGHRTHRRPEGHPHRAQAARPAPRAHRHPGLTGGFSSPSDTPGHQASTRLPSSTP